MKKFFKKLNKFITDRKKKKGDSYQSHEVEDQLSEHFDEESATPEEINEATPANTKKLKKSFLQILKNKFTHTNKASTSGSSSWGDLFNKNKLKNFDLEIFSPENRHLFHRMFLIVWMAQISYSIGKTISLFLLGNEGSISPKTFNLKTGMTPNIADNTREIYMSNLFLANTIRQQDGQNNRVIEDKRDIPCLTASTKSNLGITLLNTVVLQDEIKSVASVQLSSKKGLLSVRQNDEINGLAKIGRINRQRLVLRNLKNQECEFVEGKNKNKKAFKPLTIVSPNEGKKLLEDNSARGIQNEGNNFKICKGLLKKKLADTNNLLRQAKATPFPNPDGSLSFKIEQVTPGGVFASLGVQMGDVINQINGNKIKSMAEILELFGKVSKMANLSLGVNRGGEDMALDYTFEDDQKNENCKEL